MHKSVYNDTALCDYSFVGGACPHNQRENMMNLLQQIEAAFAESDAQSLAKLPEVIERQRNTYRELKQEILDAYYLHGINSHEYWTLCEQQKTLFSQSFKNDYDWGYAEHVARASKSLKKTHDARNDRIVCRMEKYGITKIDVDNFKVIYGEDFTGLWIIDGHQVSIKVIWAGGYNIQCLHHRVLVNVKVNKEAA